METNAQIVIGVPGNWSTRNEIVANIAHRGNGLLLAGFVLMDSTTQEAYEVEIYDHDPELAKAFEIAGRLRMSQSDIEAIRSHTFILYLIAKSASLEQAQKVLKVGCGLLEAGGLAVKVETTGKAHTAKDWIVLADANNETALYHAYVTLVGSNNIYYSCGMHNLGYRDAIIKAPITPEEAARLLQAFLLYLLIEKPALQEGHSFSENSNSPHYRLRAVSCDTYPSHHTFFNSFGMWQLEPFRNK